jgi:hypothetical protein
MSLPLNLRPEAEQELAKARDWYEDQRGGLGEEFLIAVEDVFTLSGNSRRCTLRSIEGFAALV